MAQSKESSFRSPRGAKEERLKSVAPSRKTTHLGGKTPTIAIFYKH